MTNNGQHQMNKGMVAINARSDLRAVRVTTAKEAIKNLDLGDLSPEEARRLTVEINDKVLGVQSHGE